jgi:hypothetical protein
LNKIYKKDKKFLNFINYSKILYYFIFSDFYFFIQKNFINFLISIKYLFLFSILTIIKGYPIFPGEDEHEQIAYMMEILGVPSNKLL